MARPEVRIGALTGDPAYTFGLITDLAVRRDGTIYVADVRVPVIHRYDPTGEHLGTIGREGEGPGEYRRPVGLETLSDGSLALWDYGNRRIGVYGPDGDFRRSHRVPTGLISAHRMFYADTADHFYVRTALFTSGMPPDQGLIRLSPEGSVLDTVMFPNRGDDGPMEFARETLSAWTPHRALVVGENDEYSFTIHRADGTTVTVTRQARPVRVKSGEREWWEARSERWEREHADRGEDLAPIPETKPAFEALSVDEAGRIWVRRYVEAERFQSRSEEDNAEEPGTVWRERPTYDVYTRDGVFLGTALLPYRTDRVVSRGRSVWGIQRGEFDEAYVVRFELTERSTL